jgi:hypothetical protein
MTKRYFVLAHANAREGAIHAVKDAPDGYTVVIDEPKRTGAENRLLHAILNDLAKQATWHGQKLSLEVWKRLCMAAWLRESGEQPMLVPALDGNGFDVIFERTSKLSKKQCASLIDWIFAFGAEQGVIFSESHYA